MQLTDLINIKRCAEANGLDLEELHTLVEIWSKMHLGILLRTGTEHLKLMQYKDFVASNDLLCATPEDYKVLANDKENEVAVQCRKREACYLLKARMLVYQGMDEMKVPCTTPVTQQAPVIFPQF